MEMIGLYGNINCCKQALGLDLTAEDSAKRIAYHIWAFDPPSRLHSPRVYFYLPKNVVLLGKKAFSSRDRPKHTSLYMSVLQR